MQLLKIFLVVAIGVTVCHGARNTLRNASTTATSPATLPTVAVLTSPAPQAVTYRTQTTACPDDTLTASPLHRLRNAMRDVSYTQMNSFFDAFLVFYSDEHLSEEPAAEERRLEYISGWDGAGIAAVMADGGAAIWVHAGDLRRARAVLSCSWQVLDWDDLTQSTSPVADWIAGRLGRAGRVGADARLVSVSEWQDLATGLQRDSLQLVHVPTLVDQLWNEEQDEGRRRPEFSRIVASLHHSEYTGQSWRDKVAIVRNEIRALGADAMVVTALDEVAWLLNVRGRDMPYAPLLKAFVIISIRDLRVYAPPGKLSMPVREALSVYNCFTNVNNCTRVNDYTNIYADLRRAPENKILIPIKGTFQRGASAAIAQSVQQGKRLFQPSPIMYLKAQKNPAEVKGMRAAHLRDAVAMSTILSYLQNMVSGLNEISVAMKVDVTRATQANFVGQAMRTRVAYGPNAADPAYRATAATNRMVYRNSTLVIQSGGQYIEGTTLVTRTLHYGSPTDDEKRAYTTALRSLAALATLQAPVSLPATQADPVARAPLWAAKQDYPHPTGHGVGAALNRQEDPVVIDYRQDAILHEFKEGYFVTSEPAWYETEKFGVRLGNVLEVVYKSNEYLGFTEATLVPFEPKLIQKSLLTEYEIKWLNSYNQRIRKVVGPELKDQGLTDVYYWMMNKTTPFELPSKRVIQKPNSANTLRATLWIGLVVATYVIL